MHGWHYTSAANWARIQRQGLVPYPITREELGVYFPDPVTGIWVWTRDQHDASELGSVIFQLSTKGDTRVVKLKLCFQPSQRLYHGKRCVVLNHRGTAGVWRYHDGTQKGWIVVVPVPPDHIQLVRTFDLMDVVR